MHSYLVSICHSFSQFSLAIDLGCHGCQVVQAKAETKYAIKEAERAKQAQHGEKGNRQPEVPEVFRLSSHFSF